MEYKTPIIEFLPEFIQRYREIQQITGTEQTEFDKLWELLEWALLNCFVLDADEYGIGRSETIIGITSKADDTLEERRLAVIARINESLPYSYRRLLEMIAGVCLDSYFQAELDPALYSLKVRIRASIGTKEKDALGMLKAVDALVHRVKPCNIVYDSALFEKHSALAKVYFGSAVSVAKSYKVEVIG